MSKVYDIAVIGGGVVGCAILHQLTVEGYECVLLEKEESLITGASAGNSGVYASGFDTSRNTLEGKCLAQATALNEKIFKWYNLPRGQPGAIIIAMNKEELKKLPGLLREARDAGASGCKLLGKEEIRQMEPHISWNVEGGVWIPGERAFEPWLLPITLAHVSKRCGAKIETGSEVIGVNHQPDGVWEIKTKQCVTRARTVINAAGLFGDQIELMRGGRPFSIKPRLGEYIVYDKKAQSLLRHILMPVPSELGRGVLIFPSVHGNVIVGPTAVNVDKLEVDQVSELTVDSLKLYAERVIPNLTSHTILGTYAGLRPATQFSDYQIKHDPQRNWVTVGGIRSTGASGCLAIASYVHYLVEHGLSQKPSGRPVSAGAAPSWRVDKIGTLIMDDEEYQITHPLSRFGLDQGSCSSKL